MGLVLVDEVVLMVLLTLSLKDIENGDKHLMTIFLSY